jgi:ParB family chromosome partitioning protein
MALVENLQREDLNAVEEAKGYRVLMTEYGLTQEEIANRVSKSRPVIANALRLLSLPDDLLELLEDGSLSPGLARTILTIEGDEQRRSAAEVMISKKMTVREAEAYVRKLQRNQAQSQKQRAESCEAQYIEDIERRLTSSLGRKVKIVYGKRKGRFEIEYYNQDDFEVLLAAVESLRPVEGENIQ